MDPVRMDEFKSPLLTEFAQGYVPEKYINRLVCPAVNVLTDSGKYVVDKNYLQVVNDSRGIRSKARTIEIDKSTGNYVCIEHALGGEIDKRKELEVAERIDKANPSAAAVLDLKLTTTRAVSTMLEVNRESLVAKSLFNASNYDTNYKVSKSSAKWNTTNGDPETDVDAGVLAMQNGIGLRPNAIVLGPAAYFAMRTNAKMKSDFDNKSGKLTDQQLLEALGLQYLYVGEQMVYDENTGLMSPLWTTNYASLIYIPTKAEQSLGVPAHTAVFEVTGSTAVYEFDDDEVLRIAQFTNYGVQFIKNTNGYLITDVA